MRATQVLSQPAHPAVDWGTLTSGPGAALVRVTCPVCHAAKMRPAKEVRSWIKRGVFTGLCLRDGQQQARQMRESAAPPHRAVDWGTLTCGLGTALVRVTCPVCAATTMRPAKEVRWRMKRGVFTGLCLRDRLIGKHRSDSPQRPTHPAVDWTDTVAVEQRNGSRRSNVRVTCPVCGAVRLCEPPRLTRQILSGVFDPRCRRPRGVARGSDSRQGVGIDDDRPR